jgi:hypothetical protein
VMSIVAEGAQMPREGWRQLGVDEKAQWLFRGDNDTVGG